MTMALTLLLLLSLRLFLNSEDLDPNTKTLWSPIALMEDKLFRNSTSDISISEVKISCCNVKQDK